MVDENAFFRAATLRLCSHLKIEEGLQDCLEYISGVIPADSLFLERYDHELGFTQPFAWGTKDRAERLDLRVQYDEESKSQMEEATQAFYAGRLPDVLVFNDPENEPLVRIPQETLGVPMSSAMSLVLSVSGKVAGTLSVLALGADRYSPEDAELFATLKEPFTVAMINSLKHEQVRMLKDRLIDDNRFLNQELIRLSGDEIVGAESGLRDVVRKARQVALTESVVLLTGETGVGKDVIANAIHLDSPRRDGPFIAVNCGAIPASLIDSELFGHEKGAFSGALATKRGRFERAHGGTLLLDEIGDMPLEAQVRLLRVLEDREIERVGGCETIPVDIRVIAATNRDLRDLVDQGRFREDLWYRLNVFPIHIPALRDRTVDIPALVQHFVESKAAELKLAETPGLAPGSMDVLQAYAWPGNVRELQNVIERAMIVHRDGELRFDDLRAAIEADPSLAAAGHQQPLSSLDDMMVRHICSVLERTGGKISGPGGAADLLEVNPNTLRDKMKKLGINPSKGKPR